MTARYAPPVLDLHCHSTCSDGTDEPEALGAMAAAAGLRAVALTDHDTVQGYDRFAAACDAEGVRPLRAAEISCLEEGRSAHVLCYFVSDDPGSDLRRLLDVLSGDRRRRNELLLERLAELGFGRVTAEVVREAAGGDDKSVGRPHFADAILRTYPGHFATRQAVFDELLGAGGAAYVQKARVGVAEASAAAAADGAVTVLAHPLITCLPGVATEARTADAIEARLDPLLERLAGEGLTGLECYYPRHDPVEVELLVGLARRHGLVPTGGSDYHGANKPDLSLGVGTGSLAVPDAVLEELEGRAG